MSSRFASWAAAGLVALGLGQAHAQQAPPSALAARIAATCTVGGAFGAQFGDATARMFLPPEGWAPIFMITLRRTPNSGRLHLVEASASLPDDAAAEAFIAAIEAEATRGGRFAKTGEEDGDVTLQGGGVRLELSTMGRGAYITCAHSELLQLALDELSGRARLAERPSPPQLPLPARPERGVCEDPGARRAFVSSVEEKTQNALEYGSALSRYSSALQSWYEQQLRDKSGWSEEDARALAMRVLEDPTFAQSFGRSMSVFGGFMGRLSAFAESREQTSQEARACAAALNLLDDLEQLTALSQAQWRRIGEMYQAEAQRRSVTLD